MSAQLKALFRGYKLISVKTASVIFDIPEDTLRTWVANGTIRVYRIKGLVRIDINDLLSMAEVSEAARERALGMARRSA